MDGETNINNEQFLGGEEGVADDQPLGMDGSGEISDGESSGIAESDENEGIGDKQTPERESYENARESYENADDGQTSGDSESDGSSEYRTSDEGETAQNTVDLFKGEITDAIHGVLRRSLRGSLFRAVQDAAREQGISISQLGDTPNEVSDFINADNVFNTFVLNGPLLDQLQQVKSIDGLSSVIRNCLEGSIRPTLIPVLQTLGEQNPNAGFLNRTDFQNQVIENLRFSLHQRIESSIQEYVFS